MSISTQRSTRTVVVRSANKRFLCGAKKRIVRGANNDYASPLWRLVLSMVFAMVALDATAQEPDQPADPLSVTQQQIADRFRHLEQILVRMSELTEASDPRRAALLKKTVKQGGERLVNVQFETLVELLDKDQLSRAMENQENLGKDLKALLELLRSEDRAKRIEAEKTRVRNYLKRLNQIIKQQ